MSVRGVSDQQLNELLRRLASGLAASARDHILVGRTDLTGQDVATLDAFCGLRLLEPAEPARSILCHGCERACVMPVDWARGPDGTGQRAFVTCDARSDIGRVPVELDDLRQWRFSLQLAAGRLAEQLSPAGGTRPFEQGGAWVLGPIARTGAPVDAVLCRDPTAATYAGVVITVSELPELLRVRDGKLTLDRSVWSQIANRRHAAQSIACEIKLAGGEIVLVNHVTGKQRRLAAPDFNSVNDNVFEHLYQLPGQRFTREELVRLLGSRSLKPLHKFPENLGFKGDARRLFFRVSADTISFSKVATVAQAAAQGIDLTRL
jgi:hypothetical protein